MPPVASRLGPATEGALLLKPQFEAGPAEVPRGGVIRDTAVREGVLRSFTDWAASSAWDVIAAMDCPLAGAGGNVEFLVHVRTPEAG